MKNNKTNVQGTFGKLLNKDRKLSKMLVKS